MRWEEEEEREGKGEKREVGRRERGCAFDALRATTTAYYFQSELAGDLTKFHERETGKIGPYSAGL